MPTNKQNMQIAAILGNDPSQVLITCEAPGCSKQIALANACSMAVVYRMPGFGHAPYQCGDEQHFGCCHEHAILALLSCLFSHIEAGDHAIHDHQEEKLIQIEKLLKVEAL